MKLAVPCPFVALNRFTVSIQKEMLVLMGKEARSSIKCSCLSVCMVLVLERTHHMLSCLICAVK